MDDTVVLNHHGSSYLEGDGYSMGRIIGYLMVYPVDFMDEHGVGHATLGITHGMSHGWPLGQNHPYVIPW